MLVESAICCPPWGMGGGQRGCCVGCGRGRVARPKSHAPARPLMVSAVASPVTAPCGLEGEVAASLYFINQHKDEWKGRRLKNRCTHTNDFFKASSLSLHLTSDHSKFRRWGDGKLPSTNTL